MEIADRDLAAAKRNFREGDDEWAYNIAYNAMLQAGTSLMNTHGYRPEGREHHYSVELFLGYFLDKKDVDIFSKMRKQRNKSIYERVGTISHTDAEYALERAELIIKNIQSIIQKMGFSIS
jgi:uncharacterized protein (UPF0332 family)